MSSCEIAGPQIFKSQSGISREEAKVTKWDCVLRLRILRHFAGQCQSGRGNYTNMSENQFSTADEAVMWFQFASEPLL